MTETMLAWTKRTLAFHLQAELGSDYLARIAKSNLGQDERDMAVHPDSVARSLAIEAACKPARAKAKVQRSTLKAYAKAYATRVRLFETRREIFAGRFPDQPMPENGWNSAVCWPYMRVSQSEDAKFHFGHD